MPANGGGAQSPGVGVFAPDLVRRNFNPAGQDWS
jgi:hypothetical protein